MVNKIKNSDTAHYLLHMFLFAMAFSVIGYYAPKIYREHIDNTIYYEVKNPLRVEQRTYAPCEPVDVYLTRIARASIVGKSTIQLTLIRKENGGKERVYGFERPMQATPGTETFILHWPLPCEIENGDYFFEGQTQYGLFGKERSTEVKTQTFKVEKLPIEKLP